MTPVNVASLFEATEAPAPRRKGPTPEARVLKAVVRALERRGVLVERRSVSFDAQRRMSHGTPGEPDLRLSWRGRTAGVEVKAAGGRLRDTQTRWIERHGADVPTWIVDSVTGAERAADALTGPTWPVPGADLRGLP